MLRLAQQKVWRNVRNTGLAVLLDQGEFDNIHPTNKRVVGERLYECALDTIYHEPAQLPPFADWRLPKAFAYLFGFAMVGLYWGGTRQIDWLYQASLNADMLALFAGLIQGLALMATVMNKFKVRGFWRWLFYLLILVNGLFAQILAFTGLFDMVFDYRRRFSRHNGD